MATTNFSKGIGKEYADPEQRKRFLKDNADSVVNKTYMRKFSPEELQTRKEELANISITINDIEQEKKAVVDSYKEQLKPLNEKHKALIEDIRQKATLVSGVCYTFISQEEHMTYIINEDGDCIEARPCTAEEMQKTIFPSLRATGTEG